MPYHRVADGSRKWPEINTWQIAEAQNARQELCTARAPARVRGTVERERQELSTHKRGRALTSLGLLLAAGCSAEQGSALLRAPTRPGARLQKAVLALPRALSAAPLGAASPHPAPRDGDGGDGDASVRAGGDGDAAVHAVPGQPQDASPPVRRLRSLCPMEPSLVPFTRCGSRPGTEGVPGDRSCVLSHALSEQLGTELIYS